MYRCNCIVPNYFSGTDRWTIEMSIILTGDVGNKIKTADYNIAFVGRIKIDQF